MRTPLGYHTGCPVDSSDVTIPNLRSTKNPDTMSGLYFCLVDFKMGVIHK